MALMERLTELAGPALSKVRREASRHSALPVVGRTTTAFSEAELAGFLKSQRLAEAGAHEVASYLQPGWSEVQAASLMTTWFRDHGVKNFFHYPYAWFGERTRFDGINPQRYREFMPTKRRLAEGEPFILDVAPIVDGYISDIGYASCYGDNEDYDTATSFLAELKAEILNLFRADTLGQDIWRTIDARISDAGYDNIHQLYPLSVLGHRVHRTSSSKAEVSWLNFGWQSYWTLLSRGLFGQLLNQDYIGSLEGAWAIEPHIGRGAVGVKFEEILVKTANDAYWLERERPEPMGCN